MTQQVAFTLGTPILAAIAITAGATAGATTDGILSGVKTGLLVDALALVVVAGLIAVLYKVPRAGAAEAQETVQVAEAEVAG
jgi:hypothetical protein